MIKKIFHKKLIILPFFLLVSSFYSVNVFAYCPSPCAAPPGGLAPELATCITEGMTYSGKIAAAGTQCHVDQKVGELTGSALNANISSGVYGVTTMSDHIEATGDSMVDSLEYGNHEIVGAYNDMTVNLISSIGNMAQNISKSFINFEKNNLDATLNYQAELMASSSKSQQDTIGTGTSEEIKFILNELDKADTKQTRVVIASLKGKYDSVDEFRIPVKMHKYKSLTDVSCPEYDPENNGELADYSCYKAQKADPGKTLEAYFKECSAQKQKNRGQMEEQASEKVQTSKIREPKRIMNKVNSGGFAAQKHHKDSLKVNCSFERLKNNECALSGEDNAGDMSADEYRGEVVTQIINNKIIFDGDISANNFLEPSIMGSIDGNTEITEEQEKALLKKAGKIQNQAVSTNTPELINTYKTSSQYFAANDYATNIIGRSIIGNVSSGQKKALSSSSFVGRNLQREAMLNMAQLSFSTAISKRTGTNVSDKIYNDEVERGGGVVQEDINGAAALDIMRKQVESNYENITSKNIGEDFVESDQDALKKTYETEILKARQNLEEYLNWSRIEMLLASKLVEKVSSPDNIEQLKQMKE